jgi:transcriptional regulator with XRE-family HTH domain
LRYLSIQHNAVLYNEYGDFMYKRIRDLREDNDLTQKQMASILNCSQQVYSNYELGQRDIPTAILIKLADYYDVSTDYILGRTDKK